MNQVFMSHTKLDRELCDAFDRAVARVGIRAFRSEYERIRAPAWFTIREAIDHSIALFMLVGRELAKMQESADPTWRYTQNWIAYEIGVACQKGLDVWAITDDVEINFPMPYVNNYLPVGLRDEAAFDYLKGVLSAYREGKRYPVVPSILRVVCPNKDCGMQFNLHASLPPGHPLVCPQCLFKMRFPKGFGPVTHVKHSLGSRGYR
jgi:hypothetical protein